MDQLKVSVSFVERDELQARWRSKLEEARASYEIATNRCLRLLESSRRSRPTSDSTLAQARIRQVRALNEYKRLLKIFTELTTKGYTPGTSIDHKSTGV
jgi:hypothetical protein